MIKAIEKHGIGFIAKILVVFTNQNIPSEDIRMQFILEESEVEDDLKEYLNIQR